MVWISLPGNLFIRTDSITAFRRDGQTLYVFAGAHEHIVAYPEGEDGELAIAAAVIDVHRFVIERSAR